MTLLELLLEYNKYKQIIYKLLGLEGTQKIAVAAQLTGLWLIPNQPKKGRLPKQAGSSVLVGIFGLPSTPFPATYNLL